MGKNVEEVFPVARSLERLKEISSGPTNEELRDRLLPMDEDEDLDDTSADSENDD